MPKAGRTLSPTMRASLFSRETGEVAMALLTVSHADLDEDLRLCTNPVERLEEGKRSGYPAVSDAVPGTAGEPAGDEPLLYGVTSRGQRYLFAPIEVELPQDVNDGDPTARLAIDNIDLTLIDTIRSIEEGATITLEIVLASDPDTVEITFPSMKMVSVEYDRDAVAIDLAIDPLVTEPWPGDSFTPSAFPGLT